MNPLNNFYRTFIRNRQIYLLNMMGLIPGLACCLLILLWIRYEYNIDRQYPEATKIVTVAGYHEGRDAFAGAPPIVGPTLAAENPEVLDFARVAWGTRSLSYEGESFDIISFDVGEIARYERPLFFGSDLVGIGCGRNYYITGRNLSGNLSLLF